MQRGSASSVSVDGEKVMGAWQYDERNLQRLSLVLTLRDIGFGSEEAECYMRLYLEGSPTEEERLKMLNKKRCSTLDEIHLKQKQLDCLDRTKREGVIK